MRRGDEATHAGGKHAGSQPTQLSHRVAVLVRAVLMGDGGVAPPHMARAVFETRVRDLRSAARRRGGSNTRRGEDDQKMRPHIQAAHTRDEESATPALIMQLCLHVRGASGHMCELS